MSRKLVAPFGSIVKDRRTVEHIGDCMYCKAGIYSDQEHGRARRPMIGKAHTWCLPNPDPGRVREQILAEQFPPIELLEMERPGLGVTV